MESPYLLILGGSSDKQTDRIVSYLRSQHVPLVFLDCDNPQPFKVSIDSAGNTHFEINGRELEDPQLVWTRLKINIILGHWSADTIGEYVHRTEWAGFLSQLSYYYRDQAFYDLQDVRRINSRFLQFSVAKAAGFHIPKSVYVLGRENAITVTDVDGPQIVKPIEIRAIPAQNNDIEQFDSLRPMAINSDDILKSGAEEFSHCPVCIQERICTGVEQRVIAFRDKCFAFQYRSPVEDRLIPDERWLYGGDIKGVSVYAAQFRHVEADDTLSKACSMFLRKTGLEYGAFDVIKSHDGEFWFIECNPEGQWFAADATGVLENVLIHFRQIVRKRLDTFGVNNSIGQSARAVPA